MFRLIKMSVVARSVLTVGILPLVLPIHISLTVLLVWVLSLILTIHISLTVHWLLAVYLLLSIHGLLLKLIIGNRLNTCCIDILSSHNNSECLQQLLLACPSVKVSVNGSHSLRCLLVRNLHIVSQHAVKICVKVCKLCDIKSSRTISVVLHEDLINISHQLVVAYSLEVHCSN